VCWCEKVRPPGPSFAACASNYGWLASFDDTHVCDVEVVVSGEMKGAPLEMKCGAWCSAPGLCGKKRQRCAPGPYVICLGIEMVLSTLCWVYTCVVLKLW
jgi:hypothetical protein